MDAGYLPFHPNPSKPRFVPPPGAVDAHCHVFGPAAVFPFAPTRKYTPCDAPKERLFALRDFLGLAAMSSCRRPAMAPTTARSSMRCKTAGDRARGVAAVAPDITVDELKAMHLAGVRAVRFNFLKRLVDKTPKEQFLRIAEKIAPLGWHIVVYFEASDLEDLHPFSGAASRPSSSSTTWAGPTSPGASTMPASGASWR